MIKITTKYGKMIRRQDNDKLFVRKSNANLKGRHKKRVLNEPTLYKSEEKKGTTKPYIVRQGKKQATEKALDVYDKTQDTFYGSEEKSANEGYGEQVLSEIGGSKKQLSHNIQNVVYYSAERKLLSERQKVYRVEKYEKKGLQTSEKSSTNKIGRNRKNRRRRNELRKNKAIVKAAPKPRPNLISRVALSFRKHFTTFKIAAAVATSAVPVLIGILIVVIFTSAFSVCPIDAYSSTASSLYIEISEWEAENKVKHKDVEKDAEGNIISSDTWYEWPYLNGSGVTVDQDALLAYITVKYPFLEEGKSAGAKEYIKQLYDAAISEQMHDNIRGYIEAHKDELFKDREYSDYLLYLSDPYILYRCYGSPTLHYNWQDYITSHQGWRFHPIKNEPKVHYGLDIGCPVGTEVNSIMAAKVIEVSYSADRGIFLTTEYKINRGAFKDIVITTTYEHLSKTFVAKGQNIKKGEAIALSGNTGDSTGAHLHVEIIKNGTEYINPEIVCERRNVV